MISVTTIPTPIHYSGVITCDACGRGLAVEWLAGELGAPFRPALLARVGAVSVNGVGAMLHEVCAECAATNRKPVTVMHEQREHEAGSVKSGVSHE